MLKDPERSCLTLATHRTGCFAAFPYIPRLCTEVFVAVLRPNYFVWKCRFLLRQLCQLLCTSAISAPSISLLQIHTQGCRLVSTSPCFASVWLLHCFKSSDRFVCLRNVQFCQMWFHPAPSWWAHFFYDRQALYPTIILTHVEGGMFPV